MTPLKPPKSWFEMPEPAHPVPLTVTAEGQVHGHLALWQTCHTGFVNGPLSECVMAPRSKSDYAYFHLGQLETEEGDMVAVGKLTYDTTHAPLSDGLQAASSHYDQTGKVGAFIRAVNGKLGIWASGALRSDAPPEAKRDILANPPSGDWRSFKHSLEMVAALSVPVPGFPVLREMSLAASGDISSLILSDPVEEDPRSREFLRKRAVIAASLVAAPLTTERRNDLSKSVFAIPARRAYPIHDRAHAANALARSSGKPEEAQVRRAVCRRYPDMPACGSK